MAAYESIEQAISSFLQRFPDAVRGVTATAGHPYYEAVRRSTQAAGSLHECRCGIANLGWDAPEFIATTDGKSWSVGYDATSKKISCGANGFHSPSYGNTPSCIPTAATTRTYP